MVDHDYSQLQSHRTRSPGLELVNVLVVLKIFDLHGHLT